MLHHASAYSLDERGRIAITTAFLSALLCSTLFIGHAVARARPCRKDLRVIIRQMFASSLSETDPSTRKLVVEKVRMESVQHMRKINFFLILLLWENLIVMTYHWMNGSPRWQTLVQDLVWTWAVCQHLVFQLILRRETGRQMTSVIYVASMLTVTAYVSFGPRSLVPYTSMAFGTAFVRLLWSLAYRRLLLVHVMTAVHVVCASVGYAHTSRDQRSDFGGPQWANTMILCEGSVLLCTVVWRRLSHQRALHEICATISQGENKAARKLLNTVCDATVELNSELLVAEDAPRFASMLQHGVNRSLKGMPLQNFLVDDDEHKFSEKICSGFDDDGSMANVFNVRFRDSISNVLRVEIFHVPIASIISTTSHLIGLREYADADVRLGALEFPPPHRSNRRGVKGMRRRQAAVPGDSHDGPAFPSQHHGVAARDPHDGSTDSHSSEEGSVRSGSSLSSRLEVENAPDCDVSFFFDVLSESWEIERIAGCHKIIWGSRSPMAGSRGLLQWVHPQLRESCVNWLQVTFQAMVHQYNPDPSSKSHSRHLFDQPFCFRPPLLLSTPYAFAVCMDLSLPADHKPQSTLVQMRLKDIRLIKKGKEQLAHL